MRVRITIKIKWLVRSCLLFEFQFIREFHCIDSKRHWTKEQSECSSTIYILQCTPILTFSIPTCLVNRLLTVLVNCLSIWFLSTIATEIKLYLERIGIFRYNWLILTTAFVLCKRNWIGLQKVQNVINHSV